jgi:hypothetical protein
MTSIKIVEFIANALITINLSPRMVRAIFSLIILSAKRQQFRMAMGSIYSSCASQLAAISNRILNPQC